MGSGGGVWDPADLISAARMNQKTVYIGTSAPSTTYAGQIWIDTSLNMIKIRNAANTAWVDVKPVLDKTASTKITAAGTTIFLRDDAEVIFYNTTPAKKKEKQLTVLIPYTCTLRISFDLRGSVDDPPTYNYTGYAQIYKNGSPYGTLRSKAGTGYSTFTEDLSFSQGDYVQLYAYAESATWGAGVQNFRIQATFENKMVDAGGRSVQVPRVGTFSFNPPSIAANSDATSTVTIDDIISTDKVMVCPPSALENGLIFCGASVTADKTITIHLRNITGSAIDGAARTWTYIAWS